MSLGYEFTAIDISILTHPKACAAGPEAMGLWLWGQAYAKQQKSGGRVHRTAALIAWGGKRNIMLAKRLVEAGLWLAREDGDWDVHNFERKSPGYRSRGNEPPKSSTDRVRAFRAKKQGSDSPVETDETETETDETRFRNGNGSTSVSTSLSVSSSGESERGALETGPPEWFGRAIETVEAQTGEKLRPADSWLRYSGHRANKGIAKTQQDAVYWLATVMVPEARKERRTESDKRERDAKFDKAREQQREPPPAPYHKQYKPPEEDRATAKEAAAALAKLTGGLFQPGKTGT